MRIRAVARLKSAYSRMSHLGDVFFSGQVGSLELMGIGL